RPVTRRCKPPLPAILDLRATYFTLSRMESITIRKARYPFTAQRDEAGVPHVQAADWRSAIYALGYLHALDRPTQISLARTIAAGRGAERIAAKTELAEMDAFLRRANLSKNIDAEVAALEP